ncbi:hypothetical protein MalM25_10740 [Planctomycetes bacterium MalM25]|nr:hypothetical protein MalM25_10740 [Planctomycetes bacterium MalM25]
MNNHSIRFLTLSLLTQVGLGASVDAADKSPWRRGDRIAVSADGNPDADRDDIGATPMTLAVLAKAGLQGDLVHYDFNNWLEYKKIPVAKNRMWVGALGGQTRWGFDRNKFFDASNRPADAIANLAAEINKSNADNPLYLVVAGPMELIYQAMVDADDAARAHVTLVSHSGYNEYFKPRLWHRNLDDVLALNPGIEILRIPDQNRYLRTTPDYAPWSWLRDHPDPNLKWVHGRMEAGLPDVSDTAMVTWLIGASGGDNMTTIEELQTHFGEEPFSVADDTEAPSAPAGYEPVVNLPETESVFQEVDGKIVIEAESVPLTGKWVIEKSEPGYSGDGYLRYLPENINAIHSLARGVLTYKLRITTPGKYRMALKHSHRGAPERDKWNDAWTLMGIDPAPFGNIRKTYHAISKEQFESGEGFGFQTTHDNYGTVAHQEGHFSKPVYDLAAGDHYFFIVGRSGGYRLDRIHFFKEGVDGIADDSIAPTPVLSK